MSISDILVGVNSSALNVPLNHTNWLLDYKINGTKSYVYKDKDILHELYRSPISANDEDIHIEAFNYVASELESYLGLWLSKNYGFRDLTNLPNYKSVSEIISDAGCLNRIKASQFSSDFFKLGAVTSAFATTDGLNIASSDNDIMSILENSDAFKTSVSLNPDVQTKTVSSGTNSVTNAYVLSINVGAYVENKWSTSSGSYEDFYYYGSAVNIIHGSTNNIAGGNGNKNLFVKSLKISQPSKGSATNSITYIQLDNVV